MTTIRPGVAAGELLIITAAVAFRWIDWWRGGRTVRAQVTFVIQTFNCDHVDEVVTESFSMKWISSGLRAPV